MAETLYLIDGHAQIYRAYYAPFADLHSPAGEPTRATYVFLSMLFKLLQDRRPTYWAVALDSPDASESRRAFYPEYKTNRDATPEDLVPQIARIAALLTEMDIPVLQVPGYEADDILATLTERLRHQPLDIFLVSRDKDLEQLLTDRVRLYDPGKDQVIDAGVLRATKGYGPEQAIEIQSLVGDTVDNIPGIAGVGVKTAARLIHQFGSAEAVIAGAGQLTPKLSERVAAYAPQLPITRQLVTLVNDLDVPFELEAARMRGLRKDRIKPVFEELGFTRLVDQLDRFDGHPDMPAHAAPAEAPPAPAGAYTLVDSASGLADLVIELQRHTTIALKLITTARRPVDAALVGIALAWTPGAAVYIPCSAAVGDIIPAADMCAALRPVLNRADLQLVGHDIKHEHVVLGHHGLGLGGQPFDTLIASFLLDPLGSRHDLATLASEHAHMTLPPLTALTGKGRAAVDPGQLPTSELGPLIAEQADAVLRIAGVLAPALADSPSHALFDTIEMPLIPVLAAMESTGVALDVAVLERIGDELGNRLVDLTRHIHELAGHAFNIESPQQLATVLFDEQKLRVVRRTKTGRSTAADSLSLLAAETGHPLPTQVLEYRELVKLKNTYTDSLPRMVSARSGRLHASFNVTGAVTGRLSSTDPNLQNIPIRSATGRSIRRAFVAGDAAYCMLSADYSQIELRLLAHYCQDEALLAAFADDRDIHRFVASQVFGVGLDEVDEQQRSRAKAVNFGIIYGQTPFGLAQATGMSVAEARAFIDLYFMRYPGIRMFIDDCVARATASGVVHTLLGRQRPIPELQSRNRQKRALGERLAVNTVMQGSAADLIKQAMIRIHARFRDDPTGPRMLIQVHDELVFEVHRERVAEDRAAIAADMTTALPLRVPLTVEVGHGDNWLDCKH